MNWCFTLQWWCAKLTMNQKLKYLNWILQLIIFKVSFFQIVKKWALTLGLYARINDFIQVKSTLMFSKKMTLIQNLVLQKAIQALDFGPIVCKRKKNLRLQSLKKIKSINYMTFFCFLWKKLATIKWLDWLLQNFLRIEFL